MRSSYVGFLDMFRDPPAPAQAYDARASIYPQQSLADSFKGSTDPRTAPDPAGAGYPQQPLFGGSGGASGSAQAANMPHPPSTYTAANQPYVPPPAQPAYGAPRYTAGAAPVATAAPVAAAAPTDADLAANAYPYPKQSLFDLFRGSTQSTQPTVPQPPSSYTPAGQPYSPAPGQQAYGTAQAAPPAGATPAAAASPPADNHVPGYPSQSITDVFRQ